ncbi:phosphatidylserine decarboxylase-like protein, partial [Phlebopus sp. FC_14]
YLPRDHRILEAWLTTRIAKLEQSSDLVLAPVIQEFQKVIEDDPAIYMLFHQMFEQVPTKPPYNKDPTGKPQVRNYKVMLGLFNMIIADAPHYENNDLVGFPINAILDWPMGTPAGLSAFITPKINLQFTKMFEVWSAYLVSPESRKVLTTAPNGWFGPAASKAMPNFAATYVCEPNAPYHGFKSWDDFFTREFRLKVRPVIDPDNNDVVNNACESTIYRITPGAQLRDCFWLKGEPYSLLDMLNHDRLTSQFEGGTVYQAFLGATDYHRWHSPVNGKIVKTVPCPGTYYAESPAMGFNNPDGPDPAAPNLSQAFITSLAARALIFIEADNPKIGLMCFVAVGMAEVSTCQITVSDGATVKKGDQLGMFHFGGSTHCLLFRKETKLNFQYKVRDKVELNKIIATVI